MRENPDFLCEIQNIGEKTREQLVMGATCGALQKRGLWSAGVSLCDASFEFVRAAPPFGLLLATLGGRGRVRGHSVEKELEKGEIFMSPPFCSHAYKSAGNWRVWWLTLAPQNWTWGIETVVLSGQTRDLEAATLGLWREQTRDGELSELWAEILARAVRRLGEEAHPEMARLWEGVECDLARPWSLRDLARRARWSEETLRKNCLSATGRAPMQHLAFLRFNRASSLLLRTDWTIERIAREVGYANAFAFSTAFKRWAGQSPSAFRQKATRSS